MNNYIVIFNTSEQVNATHVDEVIAQVEKNQGVVRHRYNMTGMQGFSVTTSPEEAERLSNLDSVKVVEPDGPVSIN